MTAPRTGLPEQILATAVQTLLKWNAGTLTLDECIEDIRGERAAVSILFLYFRHKQQIDELILHAASKGKVKSPLFEIAACALSQALFQTGIAKQSAVNIAVDHVKRSNPRASGFMNAVLRSALRTAEKMPLTPSFPESMRKRWTAAFGESSAESAIRACMENPPVSFRMRNGASAPEGSAALESFCDFAFFRHESAAAVLDSRAFADGNCYIQDPATGMSISLCGDLPENSTILDVCAAPGGKTVMLRDRYPSARITAADKSQKRVAQMRENFQRLHLNADCICSDALAPVFSKESFDLVFLDAPCSNTGVMRRRPDVPWRFSEKRVTDTAGLQKRLLDSVQNLVKPGGILLYSTCSVEPEEDTLQVKAFLSRYPEFRLEEEKLLLPNLCHDGAFAAKLLKTKGPRP